MEKIYTLGKVEVKKLIIFNANGVAGVNCSFLIDGLYIARSTDPELKVWKVPNGPEFEIE